MARIHRATSRNKYTCGKCRQPIEKGAEYLYYTLRPGGPYSKGIKHRRHTGCRPQPSEMTSSEYLSAVLGAEEAYNAEIGDDLGNILDAINDAKMALEEARDGCQDRLDNMPEGLQQAATGQLLQERIDACEETISELESVESDVEDAKSQVAELEAKLDGASAKKREKLELEIAEIVENMRDLAGGVSFPS